MAFEQTYADLGLGLVDASVIIVAKRLGITAIATLNHRDFTVVRPRHAAAFELLPCNVSAPGASREARDIQHRRAQARVCPSR